MWNVLEPAGEGRQGAEAALVSRGTTVPPSRRKNHLSPGCEVAQQVAHLSPSFFSLPLHPQPNVWATHPPTHNRRVPPSKGEHVGSPGRANRHTLSAFMASPPPPGGKGQGKGKARGEGRLGQGGRGRSKGGEKPMGTTAHGGKGSKGRAANGDRPVGAASCRRDHHTMASCQTPPPGRPLAHAAGVGVRN